jgi:hypothetical protein
MKVGWQKEEYVTHCTESGVAWIRGVEWRWEMSTVFEKQNAFHVFLKYTETKRWITASSSN